MVGTVKTTIVGLSGDLAVQNMGKRAKKRANEQKRLEEEEERQLRERILKANKDLQ